MSLMNAPEYDAKRERTKVRLLVGTLVAIVLAAALAVTGYLMGHGWFFENVPAELRCNSFLNTVEAGNFEKAYGIWMNDAAWQQHPQRYDYTFERFKEDWTAASDYGIVRSHKVHFTHRDQHSVIVAVTINGSPDMFFMLYETRTGTLGYSPVKLAY
jgi:hypothetical protein